MSGDRTVQIVAFALMLTLPLSALAVRRLPAGRLLGMAAIWAAIFVVLLVAVTALARLSQ